MRAEGYAERSIQVDGWPARVSSYQLGERFFSKVDNVSPGACVARAEGSTREEAESKALEAASRRLGRTRRQEV